MKRILVVDDNESFRRSLVRTLEAAGYFVLAAGDGAAALALYRKEPVDLVITDLIMPEKEGLETILELRRMSPDLKIIAVSGGGRVDADDYLPLAKGFGAVRTLSKPFHSEEILAAAAEVLAGAFAPQPDPAEPAR